MSLQTTQLVVSGLGVSNDLPPNTIQPKLPDGIHLRWAFEHDLGFPWYGFYLYRRQHLAGKPICLSQSLAGLTPGPLATSSLPVGYGLVSSDRALRLTDDFPASGAVEVDLASRQYLQLSFYAPVMQADVTVGLRESTEPPTGRHCVDYRAKRPGRGPNPRLDGGARFTARDASGRLVPFTQVKRVTTTAGPLTGLDAGWTLDIDLPCPSSGVELIVTRFAGPAEVVAYDGAGRVLVMRRVIGVARKPQLVSIKAKAIRRLSVRTRNDELVVHQICWECAPGAAGKGIPVTALYQGVEIATATIQGAAWQAITVGFASSAIDEIRIASGPAALIELCFVPVGPYATQDWRPVPNHPAGPIRLPVRDPLYPCTPGAVPDPAADEAEALGRITYGGSAAWAGAPFTALRDQLAALVNGGPGGGSMAGRTLPPIVGVPTPPDPGMTPPTMPALHPLDLVLLASLNPAVAQMVGLYWLDRSAVTGQVYDYLLVADFLGSGNLDPNQVLQQIQAFGFGQFEAWLCSGLAVGAAVPLPPPTDARAHALPGLSVAVQGGGLRAGTNCAGLRWNLGQTAQGTLLPGGAIMYHVWRDDLGDIVTPGTPTTYQVLTTDEPVLVANAQLPGGVTPSYPPDWPPFSLHYMDSDLADGWYSYEVSGIDIFGRHSTNSVAARWFEWTPVPTPRPWYYQDPPGNRSIHPYAVRLLDTTPPPVPTGVEAYALDPADPAILRDAAYTSWFNTLTPSEQAGLIGLRVRWQWTRAHWRQAPDTKEFRIYFQPAPVNALLGRVTNVVAAGPTASTVTTDIANLQGADTYVGATLRVGASGFRIISSGPATPLSVRVANNGPAQDKTPTNNRACTVEIPPGHPMFVDYSAPTNWQERCYVVPYDQHVTIVTDTSGDPVNRLYEVFVPDQPDAVRQSVPLTPTSTDPLSYGLVGVSAADDKTYAQDDPKWSAGNWGGRTGNEGKVGPPATIFVIWRTPPPAPENPVEAERVYATRADYHGHSFYTYRWSPLASSKTHVLRALDQSIFRTDWARRPRPALSASDGEYFPDPVADPRWSASKRQQVATELNALNGLTDFAAALAVYQQLSDDALRILAGLLGNEAAFSQVTIQPLDPDDPANANRRGPDNDPLFVVDAGLRAYQDTLDGRASNRYFYRCGYVDAAHNRGPLSLSSPPVWLYDVTPPRTPVVTSISGGDRQITLSWASNREPDLAEYRIYRAGSPEDGRDLRLMSLVHSEPAPGGVPSSRPPTNSWTDAPCPALVTWSYRLTAADQSGNESPPTAPLLGRAYDDSLPTIPALTVAWVSVGVQTRAQASWTGPDESRLQRTSPGGNSWIDVTFWLGPGSQTVIDPNSDGTQSYDYRLLLRKATGAIARGQPVALIAPP